MSFYKLLVLDGPNKGKSYLVGHASTIGRSSGCDIFLPDTRISREHARIVEEKDGSLFVEDLDSRNGILLNGKQVFRCDLKEGDHLVVGSTTMELQMEQGSLSGRTLEGYQLIEKIGQGGMGTVYAAKQLSMDRDVAVKILATHLADDDNFTKSFLQEARAAGKLNHPNLIQVYDAGVSEDGLYFFSMEYVAGATTLALLRRSDGLPIEDVVNILKGTAKGLVYAHSKGLLHRDIKPDNIMMSDQGEIKIADLGIAVSMQGGAQQEADGPRMGTPLYIAPERIRKEPEDPRIDIYSLGTTAYHLITGRPPFQGRSTAEILKQHLYQEPLSLLEFREDCPDALETLVFKMMAKDPAQRFQSAQEVLDALEKYGSGKSNKKKPRRRKKIVRRGVGRRPRKKR